MSRIHEQRRPPQLISSLTLSSFFGTMRYPVETGISAYLRKTRPFFFRLLEIGFRWGKTIHRGRAWTINLQTIGSTRGGTRSHIKDKSDVDSRRTIQIKGPGIIYRPGVGGGVGDFRGDHSSFGRTKGGISCNWESKRQDRWKIWKDSEGGPLKFALNP